MANSTSVTLVDLLSTRFAPIQDAVVASLGPTEVIALTSTSKAIRQNLNDKLQQGVFNINTRLQPFFQNPQAFRSVQSRCDALISGTFAYCFFAGIHGCTKLDLYVEHDANIMIQYVESEGYVEVQPSSTYEKRGTGDEVFVVDILSLPRPTAISLALHSGLVTGALAVIAWNNAYHLMPYTTFIKKEIYLLVNVEHLRPDLELYRRQERKVMSVHRNAYDKLCPADCRLLTRLRRVGDKHTWVMSLDTAHVTPSSTPDSVLEVSTFCLTLRHARLTTFSAQHYSMDMFTKLRHPVLQHMYSTPKFKLDDSDPYKSKLAQLYCRVGDATAIEMTKMNEDERPAEYDAVLEDTFEACELRGKFALPKSWCYFDEEARTYLIAAWKEQVELEELEEEKELRLGQWIGNLDETV